MVSIYENAPFRLFLSFLTAGNKSKCGTLQRLTDPQQSTVDPIFRPVSPPKRQAMQGKSFVLSPISAQTSSRLRIHGTFALLTPTPPPTAPTHSLLPQPHAPTPAQHSPNTLPTPKSHVIPPGPHSSTAQKPRNINDLISKPETPSGELRAKLLGGTRVAPPGGRHGTCGAWPGIKPTISTPGPTGVEGTGGTGGHGRASRRGAERSEVA